jgi:predicted DNA-binding protein YlxM (UPF0122 family)
MNLRKEKIELYKTVYLAFSSRLNEILTEEQRLILHLYLAENKGLVEIAEQLHLADYHIVKEELKQIKLRFAALL